MIKKNFNDDWKLTKGVGGILDSITGGAKTVIDVMLPHDAMIHELPNKSNNNGSHTGYYPGGNYIYTKKFMVPSAWESKNVFFEFEGVYCNAFVYINGNYAANRPFGYGNFYIEANDFLNYGEINEIKVVAKNGTETNSRWYTGSGIYRNVKIMVGNKLHIAKDGIKIITPDIDSATATVVINAEIVNSSTKKSQVFVETEICNQEGDIVGSDRVPLTAFVGTTNTVRHRICVSNPNLWGCNSPYLYKCSVKIVGTDGVIDEATENFGIRKLQLDTKHGLRVNGETVKLRGACIHHDNGVIGAATFERAEERRCQQLKAAGFNCIRSAHQPISKAMLEACDREGMLVIDELSDMWHHSKSDYDFALHFDDWWERETEAMVIKDFNHPCVIMYSTGNEIQEAGTAKGAEMNRRIADKIKSMDSLRFTTAAINGLMTVTDDMPEIMGDVMQDMGMPVPEMTGEAEGGGAESSIGAFNNMLALVAGPIGDLIVSHPLTSKRTEEFYAGLDICGMNYMPGRYEKDGELYPNRIILGSETYPSDIARLWGLVDKLPHVIGDMTWTGYDYLGEAGIGISFYDERQNFGSNWPSRTAYCGDIDIIGNRRPISYLREIVYGLRIDPYIAVEKVNRHGRKATQTPWAYKDCIESWTWPGYEGRPTDVDIFSASEEVELILNGKSLGRKQAGKTNGYVATFEVVYEPGTLLTIGYSKGEEDGRMEIKTSDQQVELQLEVDREELVADGSDLCYIMVALSDKDGTINRFIDKDITITINGPGSLQGFGSGNPLATAGYQEFTQGIYEGYALAVIRADKVSGVINVNVTAEGCEDKTVTINVCAEKNN